MSIWIFGYGSLIWRPNFEYMESRKALIRDRKRRFWQKSTDHRGTEAAPGRVVTLLHNHVCADKDTHSSAGTHCWGVAYRIKEENKEAVLGYLDVREQGGYSLERVPLYSEPSSTEPFDTGLVYSANEHNPEFIGPASVAEIAAQIHTSVGPSGPNAEYLLKLDEALKTEFGPDADPHVSDLADALRKLINNETKV